MKPLILTSIGLTMALMQFSHPMTMVGTISFQSLLVCLIMSSLLQSPWFSFILFLVFMGGLMVLFIYISSLASNEEFEALSMSYKNFNKMIFILLPIATMFFLLINKISIKVHSINLKEMIFKMYSLEMINIIMMTMVYLLLVLIIIVSIINLKEGPLRLTR